MLNSRKIFTMNENQVKSDNNFVLQGDNEW